MYWLFKEDGVKIIEEDKFWKSSPVLRLNGYKNRCFVLVEIPNYLVDKLTTQKACLGSRDSLVNGKQTVLLYWKSEDDKRKGSLPLRALYISKGMQVDQKYDYVIIRRQHHHVIQLVFQSENGSHRSFQMCTRDKDILNIWYGLIIKYISTNYNSNNCNSHYYTDPAESTRPIQEEERVDYKSDYKSQDRLDALYDYINDIVPADYRPRTKNVSESTSLYRQKTQSDPPRKQKTKNASESTTLFRPTERPKAHTFPEHDDPRRLSISVNNQDALNVHLPEGAKSMTYMNDKVKVQINF